MSKRDKKAELLQKRKEMMKSPLKNDDWMFTLPTVNSNLFAMNSNMIEKNHSKPTK